MGGDKPGIPPQHVVSPAAIRLATGLWILWAIVVWNVVFDHTVVVAGRAYLVAAAAGNLTGPYARMDDWMRPAVVQGCWWATAASLVILVVGLGLIRVTSRRASAGEPRSAEGRPEGRRRPSAGSGH